MIILFLAALLGITTAAADSAYDRCRVSHCTCEVQRGKRPVIETKTKQVSRQHAVYFAEDASNITEHQNRSLDSFVQNVRLLGKSDITLIGYADGCGAQGYNRNLSARRVQQVSQTLEKAIPGASINIIIHGERTVGHSANARTVEIIVHTNKSLTTRIEKIPADVYLIDGSGSMWEGWGSFKDVVNASYKPGSKIYMSMMTGCYNGQNIDTINPQGGTEIWYSYWRVLDSMKPGETLLIISDFDSNYPITANERALIRKKVQAKDITVRTIR